MINNRQSVRVKPRRDAQTALASDDFLQLVYQCIKSQEI